MVLSLIIVKNKTSQIFQTCVAVLLAMRNCGETIFITIHDIESRLCGMKDDKNQEKA